MPLRRKSGLYDAIVTAIQYTTQTFRSPPAVLDSENSKENVSAAVQEATRRLVTATRTTIPYSRE